MVVTGRKLSGPQLSVILDVEPMRPGEEECATALRLLRRMLLLANPGASRARRRRSLQRE